VSVNGNTHLGDGAIVTELNNLFYNNEIRPEYKDKATELCNRYWKGLGLENNQISLPEVLVNGKVLIVQKINDTQLFKIGDKVRTKYSEEEGVIDNVSSMNGWIHIKGVSGTYNPKDLTKI
jgi:hypothetical protein